MKAIQSSIDHFHLFLISWIFFLGKICTRIPKLYSSLTYILCVQPAPAFTFIFACKHPNAYSFTNSQSNKRGKLFSDIFVVTFQFLSFTDRSTHSYIMILPPNQLPSSPHPGLFGHSHHMKHHNQRVNQQSLAQVKHLLNQLFVQHHHQQN